MVSALTAVVYSQKQMCLYSVLAGVHVIRCNVVIVIATLPGTLFMNGVGVSFAMSTTTAGGMTVSSSGGISLDSNDSDNTKGVWFS